MDIADEIAAELADEWLPNIYREKIRSQRTRSIAIAVPAKLNIAEIQYTLLGIELKVGKTRFACPDLATARYMRVFARIGCGEFAIPYDITKISTAADELETSWQRSLLLLDEIAKGSSPRSIATQRARLTKTIRSELVEIGPGDAMPAFDRETRQRS
ncbi:MAG: hypothetical protein QM785_06695 [Pyrinomonadaceae bacterium]